MVAGTEDVGRAEDALKDLKINGGGADKGEDASEKSVSDIDDSSQDLSEKAGEAPANGHVGTEAVDKAKRVVSKLGYAFSVSELRCVPFYT
jgi:hypothetical protein